jgi:thiamine pyrophosphokinase
MFTIIINTKRDTALDVEGIKYDINKYRYCIVKIFSLFNFRFMRIIEAKASF